MDLKQIFIFLFLTFSCQFLIGQDEYHFNTSTGIAKGDNEFFLESISTKDSNFIIYTVFKDAPNKLRYIRVDSTAHVLNNEVVILPCDEIIGVFHSKNQSKIAGFYFDKEQNEDQLLIYTINKEGSLTNSLLVAKEKPNGGYHTSFQLSQSPDESKFAVITELPYQKESNEEIRISTFNGEFESLLSNNFTYSFTSQKRKVNIPVINNNGNVYIIKRTRENKKNIYHLVNVSSSGAITHDDIKLRSKPIMDMTYLLDNDGSLILSGFSSSPFQVIFEGSYIKKYQESIDETFSKEFLLPSELIESFKSKKDISKTGYGLEKFHCKSLLANENEYCLTAEHITNVNDDNKKIENREGIAVIGFTKKGDFKFSKAILTHQSDEEHNGYFNSIFTFLTNQYYVWFNEVGYYDKKADNNFDEHTFLGTRQAIINENGELNVTALSSTIDTDEEAAIIIKTGELLLNRIVIAAENPSHNKLYIGISGTLRTVKKTN